MKQTNASPKHSSLVYYLGTLAMLASMLLLPHLIPSWADGITPAGVSIACVFVGAIIGILTTNDLILCALFAMGGLVINGIQTPAQVISSFMGAAYVWQVVVLYALCYVIIRDNTGEVIARCVAYKAGVVERDEKEQGERKLLNLGHTVGHAIEKCSGYVIPHGHAVAAGLAVIARAAEALGWTEESLAARITACLSKNGLPTGTDYSAEALAEAALSDKKRAGGDITLVVPQKIGHCELRKVPVADLLPIIRAGLEA